MSQPDGRRRVAFWAFNYMPRWEAASKEVHALSGAASAEFRTHVFALNFRGERLRRTERETILPLPWALGVLPWLSRTARRQDVNHIIASAGERLLVPRFPPERTILTVSKTATLAAIERNLPALRRLRRIVVESERDLDVLRQAGIPDASVALIHPGVTARPYRPAEGPFTLLFATSPFGKHDLLSRGIHLLVQAAAQLPDVRFLLVWRESNVDALQDVIERAGVQNVEIRNGHIPDMGAVYDAVHATVLPGLEHISIKPCPHSAIESLAHGKPLLVSRPSSLSQFVARTGCGVVFEPSVVDVTRAIAELRDTYRAVQPRCQPAVEAEFREDVFRDRYLDLYREVAAVTRRGVI